MAPAWVPGRRGRGPRERDGGARPGAHERGRSPAATSIPENGPRPTIPPPAMSARVCRAGDPRGAPGHRKPSSRPWSCPTPYDRACDTLGVRCHTAGGPQAYTARQTGLTKERRPTAGNLSFVGLTSTAALSGSPGDVDHIDRVLTTIDRPSVARLAHHLLAGGPTSVIASIRDVPAERRQESCRSRPTAPSGRLSIDRSV